VVFYPSQALSGITMPHMPNIFGYAYTAAGMQSVTHSVMQFQQRMRDSKTCGINKAEDDDRGNIREEKRLEGERLRGKKEGNKEQGIKESIKEHE
jgi:hypothetical protein